MRITEIITEDQDLEELNLAGIKRGLGTAAGAVAAGVKALPGAAVKGAQLAGQGAKLAGQAAVKGYNAAKAGGRALNTVANDLATGYDNFGRVVGRVAGTTGRMGQSIGQGVSNAAQGVAQGVRSIGDIGGAVSGAITNPIGGLVGGYGRGRDSQGVNQPVASPATQQQSSPANTQNAAPNVNAQQGSVQPASGGQTQTSGSSQPAKPKVKTVVSQYAQLSTAQRQKFQKQTGLAPVATPTLNVQQGGQGGQNPPTAVPESTEFYSRFLERRI